jgi:hypothetical protein
MQTSIELWHLLLGVLGLVIPVLGGLALFYAKVSVLARDVAALVESVKELNVKDDERIPRCVRHDSRLDELERRTTLLEKRIDPG